MCIHHFFYHNPNLLVRNPYLTSISHCNYVDRSLEYYHSQRCRKPLQILGTAEQNPEALRMPEACPIDWDLREGEEPPEIRGWRIPSWEIQGNLDAHAESQRERGRGQGRGRRGRGRSRMSHPWGGADEQGGTERALGPARTRGNVSRHAGWLENEEHRSPTQVNDSTPLYQTPLAHPSLGHASGVPRGLHACELPASHAPAPNFPAANFAAADFAPPHRAAPTLPARTLSPPLSLQSTARPTNVPSPAILPGMFASFNSAPASYPIEPPTPQTDVFWTGGVPWLAEGLSEAEGERMRQEEEERRMFAMGRVEAWRGQGNGDGGMDFFNHGISRAPLEGQWPQVYAMESMGAWNVDRAVWTDTPPTFPNSNASTMGVWPGNQPPAWTTAPIPTRDSLAIEGWNSHQLPPCPTAPTPLNPTAASFTMPSPPPQPQQIPQVHPQQSQIPQSPPRPSHPRHRSPIIINSTASETLMQDFDWARWERRRQWDEMFGWFVAQARERGEDYSGGVEGLVGDWFVR